MEQAERERLKAIHAGFRAMMKEESARNGGRYAFLAWAYVRGFNFRRVEARHHMQKLDDGRVYEHNMPSVYLLSKLIASCLPERDPKEIAAEVKTWLSEPPPDPVIRQALADRKANPKSAIFYPAVSPKPEARELLETIVSMTRVQGRKRGMLYIEIDGAVHRVQVERLFRTLPREAAPTPATRSVPPAAQDGAE